MQIIDEHGIPIENPDLTKGYLKQETQTIHHDAVEAVEEVSHYETETLPDGTPAIYYDADGREKGRDVRKVVDVPGVAAQEAYDEEVEVQRYILYTEEELAEQAAAREKAEQQAKLPNTETRLAALESAMRDLLAAYATEEG
jgi:hypothetical protein